MGQSAMASTPQLLRLRGRFPVEVQLSDADVDTVVRQIVLRKRPDRTAAVRDVRYNGITGSVEFDSKGDPKKALYFVLQVVSEDPQKWGDNKEVKRLSIAAPSPRA